MSKGVTIISPLRKTLWQVGFDVLIIWPLIYFSIIQSIVFLKAIFVFAIICILLLALISIFLIEDIKLSNKDSGPPHLFDKIRKVYVAVSTIAEAIVMAYYGSYIIATMWIMTLVLFYHIVSKSKS